MSPAVPLDVKQRVDRWAHAWLARFAPSLRLASNNPGPFNYPVAVFPEWRGGQFYLCARYRMGGREEVEEFVVRQTRMTSTGFGRFDLASFRHTKRWHTTHRGLTAQQCFREIEAEEVFWPVA